MNSSIDTNDLCYGLAVIALSILIVGVAYGLCEGHLIWEFIRHS